jgi:hypothetical protein
MGAVYRAVHTGTDRTVALKVIASSFAGNEEYVERFRREARACGRLRHPGIVDVTDFGVASHEGRPLPYLVMEFLDGHTLADALRDKAALTRPFIIDVLEQVCAAVEEAHRNGILHRDLKPENVWLEPDRRGGVFVKVLDFGLAKLDSGDPNERAVRSAPDAWQPSPPVADDISATMMSRTVAPTMASPAGSSSTTGIAGTPAYMSPEQSLGEPATTRSDVYSIGVMAYRMVTGRLPFEGSLDEVLTAKREKEPPPLLSLRPDVHPDAANLVALAMSRDPSRRPASAGVFGNMIAAQLEPAGAFFTRALILFITRFRTFVAASLLASAPALAIGVVAALWQLLAPLAGWPALGGQAAVAMIVVLFIAATVSQMLMGVLPLFVVHALAAPTQPIDVIALARDNRDRIRRWLAGVLPFVAGLFGVVLLIGVVSLLLRAVAPGLRTWPVPARLAVVLGAVSVPFWIGYAVMRRYGLGVRQSGLFAAVTLIEGLPFQAAAARADALMKESGGLRNAIQKWYVGLVTVASLVFGALLGATGVIGRSAGLFIALSPLIALPVIVFLTLNGVIAALMYVSARRSKGESLERIYSDLVTTKGATS